MLGHELTHIRNGDVQLMVVAVIIAGVIGFFAELFFRMFFNSSWRLGGGRSSSSDSDRKGGGAFAIILLAVALIGVAWGLSLWFVSLCHAPANSLLTQAPSNSRRIPTP